MRIMGRTKNHGDPRTPKNGVLGRGMANKRGAALLAVVAVVTAVLLIGAAIFILGTGESDVVEYRVDGARAFYAAEGGLDRARTWLEQLSQLDPPSFPANGSFLDQPLSGGEYDVTATKTSGANPWLVEYTVVSTGTVDNVARQVRAVLRQETFSQYVYFANQSADIWFITGNRLDGRVHVNGTIHIDGDPWFGMKVTSSQSTMDVRSGSHPTFEGGYELGVGNIPLPAPADITASLSSEAQSGGVYAGALAGTDAKYEVELARGGAMGTVSYRAYRLVSGSYQWSGWTTVAVSSTNGIGWFQEPIDIKGTLDGEITIGCAENINITDNLWYRESTPGLGPDQGCDDFLGLVSAKNVVVYDTTPNLTDCEIMAHMIALNQSFTARNYDTGSPRGNLTIWGGFAQEKIGAVGTFNSSHQITHGYNKNYHYDRRLMWHSPPGFPPTGHYYLVSWTEVSPPQI
jgi:hypothetical protein